MKRASLRLASAAFLGTVAFFCVQTACEAASRSTNVTIDTAETGLISLNEKPRHDPDELLQFYEDENSRVGFNDSGEPGYARHF